MSSRFLKCFCTAVIILTLLPVFAFADDARESEYVTSGAFNTGLDTGYNETNERTSDDPHFGWELGEFVVSGFSGIVEDAEKNPVFLKSEDDEITLSFRLFQNINALNGDESLSINNDTNGRDIHFGINETDFGRGLLIIRATDYRNKITEPYKQSDYLAGIKQDRVTEIIPLQEGDYEVRLDYEIAKNSQFAFTPIPTTDYFDYKMEFKFSIRNSNSMIFLFDLETGDELTNQSFTPNGFRIDLAKSRYANINLKKEVLTEGKDGLTEDTRTNGTVQDGKEYKEEGIYTITVFNPTTEQTTEKVIYVGDDPIMKVHMITGESIEYINERLANGDLIDEETWTLSAAPGPENETIDNTALESDSLSTSNTENSSETSLSNTIAEDSLEDSPSNSTEQDISETSTSNKSITPSGSSALMGVIVVIIVIVIGVGILLFFIFRRIKGAMATSSDSVTKDATETIPPKTPTIQPNEETTIEVKIVDGEAVTIVDTGKKVTVLDDGKVVNEKESFKGNKAE